MAVTISGKNYTQFSSCDSSSAGGTWLTLTTADTASMKQGSASLCGIMKSSGTNNATFTPTSAVDLSGTKHLRIWMYLIQGSLIETYANGGIQIGITDGTNTGYYYIGGRDTYPGGWHNFVVDVSKTVDAGTKPTNMNAITVITIRIVLTALGKNVTNTWVDNLCVCDGIKTYGDDAGEYYGFEKVFSICDEPSTGGWGVLAKKAGVYCLTGSIEFGDASGTSGTKFQAKSQVVVFENRPDKAGTGSNINTNLMNFTIVDNGTGTTEFILGSKAGTAGVEGCTIRVQNTAQLAKYDLDASTDTDVDNFKLYGSVFLDADSISFPANAANVEVLNCNFESCGEVLANTAVVTNCSFISANDRGARISSTSHNITYSSFINCTHGVNIPSANTYPFNNLTFTNCTYGVENSSSGLVTVNCTDSNPGNYENTSGGTTEIINTVSLSVTVKNEGGSVIEGASVSIHTVNPQSMKGAITDDGGAQTDETTAANNATANDITLLPTTPAVNDAYYFGSDEPFLDLRINVGQNGAGVWTIVWEYYNGASWASIPDVADGTSGFRAGTGNKEVTFSPPTDWATTTVSGINAFWVRARVSAYTSITTQPLGTQAWIFKQIMNELTNASGIAQEDYNYTTDQDITVRIRKSSTGTRYVPAQTSGQVKSTGYTLTWVLVEDTNVTT